MIKYKTKVPEVYVMNKGTKWLIQYALLEGDIKVMYKLNYNYNLNIWDYLINKAFSNVR